MGGGGAVADSMDTATLDFWKELSDSSDSGIDCKSLLLGDKSPALAVSCFFFHSDRISVNFEPKSTAKLQFRVKTNVPISNLNILLNLVYIAIISIHPLF